MGTAMRGTFAPVGPTPHSLPMESRVMLVLQDHTAFKVQS